ncbi:MAG: FHA domain-containing protein [Tannerella sp.]|jgi:hypothetical protein|nr:FHA domain-containing protein [Tannerella sp.]
MEQEEDKFIYSIKGSIGSGLKALLNSSNKPYYILEQRSSTKYYRAGKMHAILVDELLIGSDSKCSMRYINNKKFTMIDAIQSAIVRSDDGWKYIRMSKQYSTFVNGQRVETEHKLENGDQIAVAQDGPYIGFHIPTGRKAELKSISLSNRLALFGWQALRPYRTALIISSILLILIIAVILWLIISN